MKRVQRKRTKGWKMPENAIYVGRPTKWGNPLYMGTEIERNFVVIGYEIWLREQLKDDPHFLDELRGKDLACWCPENLPCHGDIIIKIMKERGLA